MKLMLLLVSASICSITNFVYNFIKWRSLGTQHVRLTIHCLLIMELYEKRMAEFLLMLLEHSPNKFHLHHICLYHR